MALVRETAMDDWPALREIRLAALLDAPDAFASTYAREETLDEAAWRARIARGGSFLAYVPEISVAEPVGLAGGYEAEPGTVGLISMWVRPQARGRGVGEALITAVLGWAQARQARSVHLWVTETNKAARGLYERCGFKPTGERQPLPSNPALGELAMAREP
jgi:ribosomal protein S18 acetylase RimI-like enzyme